MTPPLDNLTVGSSGIFQRNYRVWLASNADEDYAPDFSASIQDTIAYSSTNNQFYPATSGKVDDMLSTMRNIGDMRKDSIDVTSEKGDTIMSNESGEVVINKKCSFSAELINCTPENINALELCDGQRAFIVLESIDAFSKDWFVNEIIMPSQQNHEIIIIGGTSIDSAPVLAIGEKHTGGSVSTVQISLSNSVTSVSDFRRIFSCEYNSQYETLMTEIYALVNPTYKPDLQEYLDLLYAQDPPNAPSSAILLFTQIMYLLRPYGVSFDWTAAQIKAFMKLPAQSNLMTLSYMQENNILLDCSYTSAVPMFT